MKRFKIALPNIRKMSAEERLRFLFRCMIGVIVTVFVLFRLVGYNMPYIEDFSMNAPLLTDAVIMLSILLLMIATVAIIFCSQKTLRMTARKEKNEEEKKRIRNRVIISAATAMLLILSFIIGSGKPLTIAGEKFTSTLALKAADMFIVSIIIMIIAAVATIGVTTYQQQKRNKRNV